MNSQDQATARGSALLYDAPLGTPDQDRLGRAAFAEHLARAVRAMDAREGFVIALHGPWGSGKTSVINFVLHDLQPAVDDGELIVVRFNPWWFSGTEQLLQHFFRQFSAALGGADLSGRLAGLAKKLEMFGAALGAVAVVPEPHSQAWGLVGKVVRRGSQFARAAADAAKRDLYRLREEIARALGQISGRVLVVMDDIDRLTPSEIRQVFQVVKAVADFPRTIYLLAFEREAVIGALADTKGQHGHLYLEKIVQLPFDLPPVEPVLLQQLFTEPLDEILQDTPGYLWDKVEWANLYFDGVAPALQTPRRVTRLVNLLRASYPAVRGEVHAVDFVGLQAARAFFPALYELIQDNRRELAGAGEGDQVIEESLKIRIEKMLDGLRDPDRVPAEGLLKRLFPRCAAAFDGFGVGPSFLPEWENKRRICGPKVVDVYFRLAVPSGGLREAEFRSILEHVRDPGVLEDVLRGLSGQKSVTGENRFRLFLERLETSTPGIGARDIPDLVTVLFRLADSFTDPLDRGGGFADVSDDLLIGIVVYRLLGIFQDPAERFRVLRDAIDGSPISSLTTKLVDELCGEHEEAGRVRARGEALLTDEQALELRQLALQKIRAAAEDGSLRDVPAIGAVMTCWADWAGEDEVHAFSNRLLETDYGMFLVIRSVLVTSYSYGTDDRVARRQLRVDLGGLERLIGRTPADLTSRVKPLLLQPPDWLDEDAREILQAFLDEVENPRDRFGLPREPS